MVVGAIIGGVKSAIDQHNETGRIDPTEVVGDAMGGAVIAGAPFMALAALPEVLTSTGYGTWSVGQSLKSNGLSSLGADTFSSGLQLNEFFNSPLLINIPQKESDEFDTLMPGPYAGKSIIARGNGRNFTEAEREEIDSIGSTTGCHTCGAMSSGTVSGHFIPDHQPPNAISPVDEPQSLYPQCLACSRRQGGQITTFIKRGLLDW